MGAWGPSNFENDAALDFINEEIDRHVSAIEDILADSQRFRLDEDAEGELMPRIVILTLLCEHCEGALDKALDVAAWKAQYLEMYRDQINEMGPTKEFQQQRQAVIEATFDKLSRQHQEQWQRDEM